MDEKKQDAELILENNLSDEEFMKFAIEFLGEERIIDDFWEAWSELAVDDADHFDYICEEIIKNYNK